MFLQMLRGKKKKKKIKEKKEVLQRTVYVQDRCHFDTCFSSPHFEAEVQGIHATDM